MVRTAGTAWAVLPVAAVLAACGGNGGGGGSDDPGPAPDAVAPNVAPRAVFTATPAEGQAPLEVTFDASLSSDPDGSISRHSWEFDDSGVGEGRIVQHRFADPGRVNAQCPAAEVPAIEIGDRRSGLCQIWHIDKTEPS